MRLCRDHPTRIVGVNETIKKMNERKGNEAVLRVSECMKIEGARWGVKT